MEEGKKGRVCVTGAGGYIASWLVKLLLSEGYMVHGTVRDTGAEKNSHLKKLEKAMENLQLFNADLLDYDSIASAVAGCEGVFHVASPCPATKVDNPEVELIAPAVTGTLNVLKACSEANVYRVVVVSSADAVISSLTWPKDKTMDENCWSDKEYCRKIEHWYGLSKTQAESEAIYYGKKHGLDIITFCPTIVIGPLLQPTVNASSAFLISLLRGNESVKNRNTNFVDVRDVADALLLVYQKPEASGRYLCAPHGFSVRDVVDILKKHFPVYSYPKEFTIVEGIGVLSSEKLKKLGWKCRPFEESVIDSVTYYQKAGILDN